MTNENNSWEKRLLDNQQKCSKNDHHETTSLNIHFTDITCSQFDKSTPHTLTQDYHLANVPQTYADGRDKY